MLSLRGWVKSPQDQLWWWAVSGPMLLICSLLALGLRAEWVLSSLPLVLVGAVPICSRFGVKGLALCCSILVLAMARDLRSVAAADRVWYIGVGAAVSLALTMMVLAREEVSKLVKRPLASVEHHLASKNEVDANSLLALPRLSKQIWGGRALAGSRVVADEEAVAAAQAADDRYRQLQKQYQAKSDVLDETRVSVWQVETRLEQLLHEQAEHLASDDGQHGQLVEEMAQLSAQYEEREREIGELEELVNQLLEELKRRCVPGLSGLRIPRG